MIKKLLILSVLFVVGCDEKLGMVEFVNVTKDHAKLTNETCDALVLSIKEEATEIDGKGQMTAENKVKIDNLLERLDYMKRQSTVIYEYVLTTQVDKDLVQKMTQASWKNGATKGN